MGEFNFDFSHIQNKVTPSFLGPSELKPFQNGLID